MNLDASQQVIEYLMGTESSPTSNSYTVSYSNSLYHHQINQHLFLDLCTTFSLLKVVGEEGTKET